MSAHLYHDDEDSSSHSYGPQAEEMDPYREVETLKIQLKVIQGDQLVAKDRDLQGCWTTSDPYVCVSLLPRGTGGHEIPLGQSSIVLHTLKPKWNYETTIEISREEITDDCQFCVTLMDWEDDVLLRSVMGIVPVNVTPNMYRNLPFTTRTRWYGVPAASADRASGRIQCQIDVLKRRKRYGEIEPPLFKEPSDTPIANQATYTPSPAEKEFNQHLKMEELQGDASMLTDLKLMRLSVKGSVTGAAEAVSKTALGSITLGAADAMKQTALGGVNLAAGVAMGGTNLALEGMNATAQVATDSVNLAVNSAASVATGSMNLAAAGVTGSMNLAAAGVTGSMNLAAAGVNSAAQVATGSMNLAAYGVKTTAGIMAMPLKSVKSLSTRNLFSSSTTTAPPSMLRTSLSTRNLFGGSRRGSGSNAATNMPRRNLKQPQQQPQAADKAPQPPRRDNSVSKLAVEKERIKLDMTKVEAPTPKGDSGDKASRPVPVRQRSAPRVRRSKSPMRNNNAGMVQMVGGEWPEQKVQQGQDLNASSADLLEESIRDNNNEAEQISDKKESALDTKKETDTEEKKKMEGKAMVDSSKKAAQDEEKKKKKLKKKSSTLSESTRTDRGRSSDKKKKLKKKSSTLSQSSSEDIPSRRSSETGSSSKTKRKLKKKSSTLSQSSDHSLRGESHKPENTERRSSGSHTATNKRGSMGHGSKRSSMGHASEKAERKASMGHAGKLQRSGSKRGSMGHGQDKTGRKGSMGHNKPKRSGSMGHKRASMGHGETEGSQHKRSSMGHASERVERSGSMGYINKRGSLGHHHEPPHVSDPMAGAPRDPMAGALAYMKDTLGSEEPEQHDRIASMGYSIPNGETFKKERSCSMGHNSPKRGSGSMGHKRASMGHVGDQNKHSSLGHTSERQQRSASVVYHGNKRGSIGHYETAEVSDPILAGALAYLKTSLDREEPEQHDSIASMEYVEQQDHNVQRGFEETNHYLAPTQTANLQPVNTPSSLDQEAPLNEAGFYMDADGVEYYLDKTGIEYYRDADGGWYADFVPEGQETVEDNTGWFLDVDGTKYYVDENGVEYYQDPRDGEYYGDQGQRLYSQQQPNQEALQGTPMASY